MIWNNHNKCGRVSSNKKVGYFCSNEVLKTLNTYKGFSMETIEDGHSFKVWYDPWDNGVHSLSYP
jgi:hypothetical protein